MKSKVFILVGFMAAVMLMLFSTAISAPAANNSHQSSANEISPFLVEYPLPSEIGSAPWRIAIESPGRVWFTMPAENALGRLVVTSTVDFQFTRYEIPTPNSEPYDLVYRPNAIWFTQRTGNQLGRLTISSGDITEYPIPTTNSQPTGIDIAPDGTVWFLQRGANQIASFQPTENQFEEYPYTLAGGQLENVRVQNDDRIWFTAPGVDRLVGFRPSRWGTNSAFFNVPAEPGSQPHDLFVPPDTYPWITAPGVNLIGRYTPTTFSNWRWFALPTANSEPAGIAYSTYNNANEIWYTGRASGKAGRLLTTSGGQIIVLHEIPLPSPNSQPEGIRADSQRHVWIADTGGHAIVEWRPPHFNYIYLPIILKP